MTESRSIREYTEQEISPAVKEQILLAGCAALTGENQQPYTILDITDHSIQNQLAELCDHQPFIARAKMSLYSVQILSNGMMHIRNQGLIQVILMLRICIWGLWMQ
ncbi:MAG: hypothetical protein ACI32G_07790 [Bulleidia sp.]